jgi:tRNA pseudouridine38-40 synthase
LGEAVYRVTVEYDGTDFSGFQYQPQGRTVAGELERALSRLFDVPVKVTAAGRTDAGVHASGQCVSFVAHDTFPIERLDIALNSALPPDLSVRDAALAEPGFSARLSAIERYYSYAILNRPQPSALLRRWTHFEYRSLDLQRLARAAGDFIGTHDFVSFCGVLPEHGDTVRTLHSAQVECSGELVLLHFRGNGFLHRMVRIIAGTLLDVAAGRRDPDSMRGILAARDRRAAGPTAQPQGLYLTGVRYERFTTRRPLSLARFGPTADV